MLYPLNSWIIILGLLLITNCTQRPAEEKKIQNLVKKELDPSIKEIYENAGFIRLSGSYLEYECEGENLFIKYGNDQIDMVLEDTFSCEIPYVGTPILWWDNENFICLRYGCGSPCWGAIVLPLNEQDTVQYYMYFYDYDDEESIIVYLDYEIESEFPPIVVRNLKTRKVEIVKFEPCGDVIFGGYCIDSLSYHNGNLFLRTKSEEEIENGWNSKGSNIIRMKVNL